MSQFRTETVPFPFFPVIIICIFLGIALLVSVWVVKFVTWHWNNRDPPRHHYKKSKKKTKRSHKRYDSDSSD